MTYTLYKITHRDTDRAYIGLTRQPLEVRCKLHVTGSASARPVGDLQRALREHGSDAFDCIPLETAPTRRDAAIRERELIIEHGTLSPRGFNSTTGGEMLAGNVCSESTVARIRAARRDRPAKQGPDRSAINMRFDVVLLERIDASAKKRGISRTAWVHWACAEMLGERN